MEFLKHFVKIMDNLAPAVLAGTIAPAVKSLIEDKPVPSDWGVFVMCAFLFYLLIETLALWLLYNFIDFPRKTKGGEWHGIDELVLVFDPWYRGTCHYFCDRGGGICFSRPLTTGE